MRTVVARYIRNPDNYFFDLFDAAIAGTLSAAGHETVVVERMAAPGFEEEELIAGLAAFVADQRPELIFLPYVPLATLPVQLAAATGARVVAFGTRLLLELPGIDFVVAEPDPLACLELVTALAGGESDLAKVAALSWRAADGTVCAGGKGLHPVSEIFAAGRIDYGRFYRLGPGRPPEVRKHIAGDWGCSYRRADPQEPWPGQPDFVPRGGCTFCTRPAWEGSSWEAREPILAGQLDSVLAAFPGVAKLVLIDEQGLSYVADLARLLLSRPVAGMQLLVSGRLDHLARYQGPLRLALEMVRESCTISLYQFGIENLADSVLERYHKGLRWEEIERGIGLARSLVANHGNCAIEPSFGFILFDPWTTVAELRLNVERARRLELESLRGQAPFTALRLVPEMALYWRARADGLLLEGVADNAFGYSADRGWRFHNPEVAAIYRQLLRRRGERPGWTLLEELLSL